jgi:predicted CXXCH cytochrome family protein
MKAITLAALLVGLWAGQAGAEGFDDVLATKHNLFPGGEEAMIQDVCLICHVEQFVDVTPQVAEALPLAYRQELLNFEGETLTVRPAAAAEADQIQMPLWDPITTLTTFLPLPTVGPSLGKGSPDSRPFGPSFACLSCHDGVLGNDIHQRGFSSGQSEFRTQEMVSAAEGTRSPDHPDSIVYPRKSTGEFMGHRADPNLMRYWSIPDRDENGVVVPTGPKSTTLNLQDIDAADPTQTANLVRTYQGVIHCDTCHNPHLDQNRPFLRLTTTNLCLVCHQR